MKKFVKYFFRFLVLLIVGFVMFYFWASSPTLNKEEYAKIIIKENVIDKKKDSVFSIMTYNIGYLSGMTNNLPVAKPKSLFDENLNKVRVETKKINPDIIAFQEIDFDAARSYHINQEEEVANLGYKYIARTINWDEHYLPFPYWPIHLQFGKVISGQSVISKYPLKDQERVVLQRVASSFFYRDAFYLERLAQVVKVTVNQTEIILINVHLEAFDKPTRVKQFDEVLAIFNKFKNEYPTILLGDFNSRARDESAAIQQLLNKPNIGVVAFDTKNIENTFNSKNPFERIDYIFYTKNSIEYLSGSVLNSFGESSDHLPVFMKFKLK